MKPNSYSDYFARCLMTNRPRFTYKTKTDRFCIEWNYRMFSRRTRSDPDHNIYNAYRIYANPLPAVNVVNSEICIINLP